jgi:hypothetical protein
LLKILKSEITNFKNSQNFACCSKREFTQSRKAAKIRKEMIDPCELSDISSSKEEQAGLRNFSSLMLNQPVENGFSYSFRFGMHLQFSVDAAQMKGNGVDTNIQFSRRRFIVMPFNQKF